MNRLSKWAWLISFPAYVSHFYTELLTWAPEVLPLQWAMSRVLAPWGVGGGALLPKSASWNCCLPVCGARPLRMHIRQAHSPALACLSHPRAVQLAKLEVPETSLSLVCM